MLQYLIPAAASLIGGALNRSSTNAANKSNIAHQKEFAQSGIQWRVEDAKKAGIHPLAALGAQTHSFAPSVVGDTSFGTGVAAMGQDIGRAMHAQSAPEVRARAVQSTIDDLTVQRMGLENQLLASKIATFNQPGMPPGIGVGAGGIIGNQARPGEVGPNEYPLPLPAGAWRTGPEATAEQIERDYGDVAQNVYGVWRGLDNWARYNMPRWGVDFDEAIKAAVSRMTPLDFMEFMSGAPYDNRAGRHGAYVGSYGRR